MNTDLVIFIHPYLRLIANFVCKTRSVIIFGWNRLPTKNAIIFRIVCKYVSYTRMYLFTKTRVAIRNLRMQNELYTTLNVNN